MNTQTAYRLMILVHAAFAVVMILNLSVRHLALYDSVALGMILIVNLGSVLLLGFQLMEEVRIVE